MASVPTRGLESFREALIKTQTIYESEGDRDSPRETEKREGRALHSTADKMICAFYAYATRITFSTDYSQFVSSSTLIFL